MTTLKKLKIIGKETAFIAETGEIKELDVVQVEERDFNFTKVWMRDFLSKLDNISNIKTRIAYWIVDNINQVNELTYTYRQIAERSGFSLKTVANTMKILQDADFLRQKNQGCYLLNPNLVFKGGSNGRLNILTEYKELGMPEKPKLSQEQQLENLLKHIAILTKQAEKIQEEITSKKITGLRAV